jgi:hypothetical protein
MTNRRTSDIHALDTNTASNAGTPLAKHPHLDNFRNSRIVGEGAATMTTNDDRLSDLDLGDHFDFRHSHTFETFDTEKVALTVARVEKTGALDLLARWQDEDAPTAGRSVRAVLIPQRAVLVGLLLLADGDSPLWINSLAELLQHRLTAESRALLGLPESATTDSYDARARKRWYSTTHSAFHRLLALMDPFPQSGWKSYAATEVQAVLDGHDPAREAKMKDRLDQFTNAFLQMTFGEQPRRLRHATGRIDIALGTKFIASRNRTGFSARNLAKQVASEVGMTPGERRPGPVEIFAGWYARTENQSEAAPGMDRAVPAAQKATSDRGYGWGWAADFAVRVDSEHPNEPRFPQLAMSATMRLPHDRAPKHALSLMRSALDTGLEAGIVDTDRAHFPHAPMERPVDIEPEARSLDTDRAYFATAPRQFRDTSTERAHDLIGEASLHNEIFTQHPVTVPHEESLSQRSAFVFGSMEWEQFHRHTRRSVAYFNYKIGEARVSPRVGGFAAAQVFLTLQLTSINIRTIINFLSNEQRTIAENADPAFSPTRVVRLRAGVWNSPLDRKSPTLQSTRHAGESRPTA